ncbi:hypothetical protein ACOMHN_014430 [Nucella lapillus]
MLFSAVSPEIRKMQMEQELQSEAANSGDQLGGESDGCYVKSFFSNILSTQVESPEQIEICLDEVAKTLGVHRRRIYNIVHGLESVEVVSRMAKKKYVWHGKTNLNTTLTRLKQYKRDFKNSLKERELAKELNPESCPAATPEREGEVLTPSGPEEDPLSDLKHKGELGKDKSFVIISQKFLMLFLVSKIRRLYDIANILTSLKLIKKVAVTEFRGRKPAFQVYRALHRLLGYRSCAHLCYTDGRHRPSTRQSMLDCIRNESTLFLADNTFRPIRPALPTGALPLYPAGGLSGPLDPRPFRRKQREMSDCSTSSAPAFSSHASLDHICAVVESELTRLHRSTSQPCSPIKKLNFDVEESPTEPKRCNTDPPMESSLLQQAAASVPGVPVPAPAESVPVATAASRVGQRPSIAQVFPRTSDTVIIKAKSFFGSGGRPIGKVPAVLSLNPVQVKGILELFKRPVGARTRQDASTQCSMDKVTTTTTPGGKNTELLSPPGVVTMATLIELMTPVSSTTSGSSLPALIGLSRKRGFIDVSIGGEKRIKVDMTTTTPNS